VLKRYGEVPSLAVALSSTVDLIEGRVDAATTNGVHGPQSQQPQSVRVCPGVPDRVMTFDHYGVYTKTDRCIVR
jgi:hypothetical protein